METKYDEIYAFLSSGSYPEEYDRTRRQNLRRYASKFTLRDGVLFFGDRRAIRAKEEASSIFSQFHVSAMGGHLGIHKTRSAVSACFYWYGMSADIEKWTQACDNCQKVGKRLTASQPLQPLQCIKVSAVWDLMEIDLIGPLPETLSGHQYILTATDYFSKWVEAFPMKTKSASEVAEKLVSMIYRHGCPLRILSDQDGEFIDELNMGLCHTLHIEQSVIAAYHPQINGLDEETNDNIKKALENLVNEEQSNWDTFLDATLFSLRSKVHTTTKSTPFRLMYGREAHFPAEVPAELPAELPQGDAIADITAESSIQLPTTTSPAADLPSTCHVRKKKRSLTELDSKLQSKVAKLEERRALLEQQRRQQQRQPQSTTTTLTTNSSNKEDDEVDRFGQMVGGMLRRLPEDLRPETMFEVHKVLYETQQKAKQLAASAAQPVS